MDHLPTEVLVEIIKYLPYFDLRRCQRINSSFGPLIALSGCEQTLFKSTHIVQPNPAAGIRSVDVHPAFSMMRFEAREELQIEDICFALPNDSKVALVDFNVGREQAVQPAVDKLRIQILPWAPITVRNKNGITVLQVMKAVCKFIRPVSCIRHLDWNVYWTDFDRMSIDEQGLTLRATYLAA